MASMISSMGKPRRGRPTAPVMARSLRTTMGSRPSFLATTVPEAYCSPSSRIFLRRRRYRGSRFRVGTPAVLRSLWLMVSFPIYKILTSLVGAGSMVCVIWIVRGGVWGYGAGMDLIGSIAEIPALEAGQVVVWGAEVSAVSDSVGDLFGLLSGSERLKAERLQVGAAREASVVARGGLRVLLGAYAGVAADAVVIEQLEGGKPVLGDGSVAFSVAHSGDWVVWAFARGGAVGVDLERVRSEVAWESVAKRYFSGEERALLRSMEDPVRVFFDLWVMKEALVKASGVGVFEGMGDAVVSGLDMGVPERAVVGDWFVQRVEAGSKYACAVASDGEVGEQPCYDFGGMRWRG